MIVELLNTAVEPPSTASAGAPRLSKRAKDMGSAAVLLPLLLAGGIWAAAVLARFGG
jgi:diacylglycerol kinase (ATP)